MSENRHASRGLVPSRGRLVGWPLVFVTVIATSVSFTHAKNCRAERWAACYDSLKTAVEKNHADDALSIVNDLLAAGHDEESQAKHVTGMRYGEYYVYYYQALALLRTGSIDAARQAAMKTGHPLRDDLLARLQPPRMVLNDPKLIETQFETVGGKTVERAVVHVSGVVFDNNGLESIKARSVLSDTASFEFDGKGFKFEDDVTLDASMGQFELIATDTTGLSTPASVKIPLSPLKLGDSAARIQAVLIGIDVYDTTTWWSTEVSDCRPELRQRCPGDFKCYPIPELGAAENDANRFAELLRLRGVPEHNIHLLSTKVGAVAPTKPNIEQAIKAALAAKGETVIFFFAGHGAYAGGENLLLPSDTQGWECKGRRDALKKDLLGSTIRVSDVRDMLRGSAFTERYLLLDACRTPPQSRTIGEGSQALPAFRGVGFEKPEDKQREREPVTIYATQDNEVSVEWTEKHSGYFTWFLLQALRRDMSLRELEVYVQEEVRKRTFPEQVPVFDWPKEYEDVQHRSETYIMRQGSPQ
jgi:Uncharacterized protein containing caspase domain